MTLRKSRFLTVFLVFVYVLGGGEMSVKLKFDCPADGGMVQRSRSFTGVNALGGRRR